MCSVPERLAPAFYRWFAECGQLWGSRSEFCLDNGLRQDMLTRLASGQRKQFEPEVFYLLLRGVLRLERRDVALDDIARLVAELFAIVRQPTAPRVMVDEDAKDLEHQLTSPLEWERALQAGRDLAEGKPVNWDWEKWPGGWMSQVVSTKYSN